jgi:hypothetical protein
MRTVTIAALASVLIAASASAQAPVSPSAKIKFELDDEQVRIIGLGLMELPYKTSATVMGELQRQINEQQKPPPAPSANAKPDEKPTKK